jgi:FecR protein
LGLIFSEIRNLVAFRLLSQHFAARTGIDRRVKRGDGRGELMSLVRRVIAALLLTGAAALLLASSTLALERVGVVTNIEGIATVARVALPEPRPLQFKDDLFLRDRITTGERSFVRVLLGGKATVTARERSVLTITEVPGVATLNLGAGRAAVAVAKGLMKPGEVIEIRTPNAVTAIRGTVVIAEVQPVSGGHQSTITILRGLVDVTRLNPAGAPSGPAVKVGALERVSVIGAQPVTAPQKITREAAASLAADFSLVPKSAPAASTEALSAEVKQISLRDAMQLVGATAPSPTPSTSGQGGSTAGQGVGGVGAVVGGVTNTASGAVGAATNGLSTLTGGVTNTLSTVTGTTGAVTGLTAPVTQAVAPVINPVTSPVTNLVTTATNTVNTVTNPVTNTILPNLLHKP